LALAAFRVQVGMGRMLSLAASRRIGHWQMAADQFRKGRSGAILGVLAQEFGIFTHSAFTL
jgi:hypothetical protein